MRTCNDGSDLKMNPDVSYLLIIYWLIIVSVLFIIPFIGIWLLCYPPDSVCNEPDCTAPAEELRPAKSLSIQAIHYDDSIHDTGKVVSSNIEGIAQVRIVEGAEKGTILSFPAKMIQNVTFDHQPVIMQWPLNPCVDTYIVSDYYPDTGEPWSEIQIINRSSYCR